MPPRPAVFPTSLVGERALHALLTVHGEATVVAIRSTESVSYALVFSTFLATAGPLCLAALRGSALHSQGSGVNGPGSEHPEKWPDKHLSAEKGLQEDGMGLQRVLF